MIKSTYLLICLSFSVCSYAQTEKDTIETVVILPKKKITQDQYFELSEKDILQAQNFEIGNLLAKFPGVQLRSYGDAGAMKTISFRGLGSSHSFFSEDGFFLSQSSFGQTDVSQFGSYSLKKIEQFNGVSQDPAVPLSLKIGGAGFQIMSNHVFFQSRKKVNFQVNAGRFNDYSASLSTFIPWKKSQLGFSLSARTYEGIYPFVYQNFNNTIKDERQAANLFQWNGKISYLRKIAKSELFLSVQSQRKTQDLISAVIFYNNYTNQDLFQEQHRLNLQFSNKQHDLSPIFKASAYIQKLNYSDSTTIFNLINNDYLINGYSSEFQISKKIEKHLNFNAGIDFSNESLKSNALTTVPSRTGATALVNLSYQGNWQYYLQLGQRLIKERSTLKDTSHFQFCPMFTVTKAIKSDHLFRLTSKITYRMPSFSEMYYQQIGNSNLKPEKASQIDLQYAFEKRFGKHSLHISVAPYYSYLLNKIIAIPSSNNFIWTILNVGKSTAYGVEVFKNYSFQFKKVTTEFSGNYTLTISENLSDPKSSSYKNRLAYTPEHLANAKLAFTRKKAMVYFESEYLGDRYALNQNIIENYLSSSILFHAGFSQAIEIKKHLASIRIRLNNITNKNIAYVRYYYLPGFNVQVQLAYSL